MLKFSDVYRNESDKWHSDGPFISDPETLEKLRLLVEQGHTLVAEHWHYRGGRAPDRFFVEDHEDFIDYLKANAIAGDIVDVFDITSGWQSKGDPVVSGKCPDERGEIPTSGPY
jgi:hypothetical protein